MFFIVAYNVVDGIVVRLTGPVYPNTDGSPRPEPALLKDQELIEAEVIVAQWERMTSHTHPSPFKKWGMTPKILALKRAQMKWLVDSWVKERTTQELVRHAVEHSAT